jgi:Cu2+-exporting ATPase
LGLDGEPFYWELATLLVIMLLGHWMEMRSVQAASSALEDLASMIPSVAILVTETGAREVDISSLRADDLILVRPGSQVPADGVIVEGATSMNEAFLTGESRPVAKGEGDESIAGSVNGEGAVTIKITRTGDTTTLSQIMRLVEEAQNSRSHYQVLADRAAFWLTIVAIGVAVPTFVGWAIFGSEGTTFAIARAVTVLVIACPHALGLAIPLVNMNATSISASNGVLVRNREAFERGRDVKFVAFDKTGTLTEGSFVVSRITALDDDTDSALGQAAALEMASEHPLAKAVIAAATDRQILVHQATSITAVPGRGLEGMVDGRMVRLGRPEWAEELSSFISDRMAKALDDADDRGESALVLVERDAVQAVITVADKVRDTSSHAVDNLLRLGMTPVLISGDAEATVSTVAGELGIDRYFSRVLPQDKAGIVAGLSAEGTTAFVGDGINDAPALLTADLGIAIGAGTNVAIESADLVLVEDDPTDVVRVLILSKETRRKMLQNLAWATGYNLIAIPLAAGVAASVGIVLSPAIGAVFMSLSTVIVAINAMLLRRLDLSLT